MSTSSLIRLFDYEKWVASNSPKKFSLYDYLHGVFKTANLAPDVVIAFFKLVSPEFYCYEGDIFLKEEFKKSKYDDLVSQGCTGKDLEYWMNILTIDGLFENSSLEISKYIANQIVALWKVKLKIDFPTKQFETKCLFEQYDEVYVVFYQKR